MADYAGLATVLAKIRGRFILSVNDVPETREFFDQFSIEPFPPLCDRRRTLG
jgi:DNA adenine methylase